MFSRQEFGIQVINLDRSPHRWEHIASMLADHHLEFERLKAVDFKDYDSVREMRKKLPNVPPLLNQGGQIGCFMSHMKALEIAMASTRFWTLILEDDVDVGTRRLKFALTRCVSKNRDQDIIYVNGRGLGGSDAYFVKNRSALLIRYLAHKTITDSRPRELPLDWLYADIIKTYGVKAVFRPHFTTREFPQEVRGTRF